MDTKCYRQFILILCLTATFLFCAALLKPAFVSGEEYLNQGKDQLVDALDAAFVRVVDSGQWQAIMDNDTLGGGDLAVYVADCYPNVEETPFPENPTGLLAEILSSGLIKVGTYESQYQISADIFSDINDNLLRAIIDELGQGYGLSQPIQIEFVEVWPPSSALLYGNLQKGRSEEGGYDITFFNAALGATASFDGVSQRRRKKARFTCTVFSSQWYIHVKDSASYQTITDLQADENAVICSGMLSSRLSRAWFKNQTIDEVYENDLEVCSERVQNGTDQAYLYFGPTPALPDLRAIKTPIIAGVPIWVAGDQDQDKDRIADDQDLCPSTYDPCQTDADGDGEGDMCDSCTDSDGDGYGDPGYANTSCSGGPEDTCPAIPNPGQQKIWQGFPGCS